MKRAIRRLAGEGVNLWEPEDRCNFGAIRGRDCTVRFRVSDTSSGT
jgi:hypothetical protein